MFVLTELHTTVLRLAVEGRVERDVATGTWYIDRYEATRLRAKALDEVHGAAMLWHAALPGMHPVFVTAEGDQAAQGKHLATDAELVFAVGKGRVGRRRVGALYPWTIDGDIAQEQAALDRLCEAGIIVVNCRNEAVLSEHRRAA